jgi:K+-sensing histidine kinase KdpD
MPSQPTEQLQTSPPSDIPWSNAVQFVRQLSHDLRNHLNAAELQAAFLGEIATDPEMKDEVKRLRQMLSVLGSTLQKLSADMGYAKPHMIEYRAADFFDDIRKTFKDPKAGEGPTLQWENNLGNEMLNVDPQLLQAAIQELVDNARRHASVGSSIKISGNVDLGTGLVLTLEEPKERFEMSTKNWGLEPMRQISHGHYGLGLNRARIIVELHGGRLTARYDDAARILLTTVTLPLHSTK